MVTKMNVRQKLGRPSSPYREVMVAILTAMTVTAWFCGNGDGRDVEILVGAAASLQAPMDQIAQAFERSHRSIRVTLSFAGSGTIRHQIESGAPIDIFLSAGSWFIDSLDRKGLVLKNSRVTVCTNSLVLAQPLRRVPFESIETLKFPQVRRIAIGDPETVPAGRYAMQTFDRLGVTDTFRSRLVYTQNVRQVLTYLETATVDAGVLYTSDAASSTEVRIIQIFPDSLHEMIVYPAVVLSHSRVPDAAYAFLRFLRTDTSRVLFRRFGFGEGRE